jgi:hypothetical protein
MSYKQRIKRLEEHLGTDCQNHQAVIVYRSINDVGTWQAVKDNHLANTGVAPQFCPRCGAELPLLVFPPKLSVEEWTAQAEVWHAADMRGATL